MAARREQGNSVDLAGRVEGTFMAAPLVRNLFFDFKPGADITPIPQIGTWSTLNTITPPWVLDAADNIADRGSLRPASGGSPSLRAWYDSR
jgi:hypothetical protein